MVVIKIKIGCYKRILLYFGWSWFFTRPFTLARFPFFKDKCGEDNCTRGCEIDKRNITKHKDPTCYYGQVSKEIRHDEFLVILGRDLVGEIVKLEYCLPNTSKSYCLKRNLLFDTNYGGNSLGLWINKIQYNLTAKAGKINFFDDPIIKGVGYDCAAESGSLS